MTHGLRAQESTLFDMLRPGVEMAMPPYQRSYSWDEKEVKALFQDLIQATEDASTHFMGAIVLERDSKGRVLIVDGQQRLTTLTILLAVLRDLETGKDQANALHNLIVDEKNGLLDKSMVWRMNLNHLDGPFFREVIQSRGATLVTHDEPSDSESQSRLVKNTAFLIKSVKALGVEDRRRLATTMLENLILVRVVVPESSGSYHVFKVLNTRGKAPNNHDIIKTELLEKADLSAKDAKSFSQQWSEHEARLGGSGLDKLLNHIRTLYSRNSKSGLEGFRKAVLSNVDARAFLSKELPAYVDAFIAISTAETDFTELNEEIKRPLSQLNLIDHGLWRAPAMKFLVNNDGNAKTALDFFTKLERFAFTMMLVVTERPQRLKRYGRIADTVDRPESLLSARGPLTLSRDERRKLQSRLLGRFGSFSQRRAITLRLNAAIEGGLALKADDGATIEHVLPRHPPEDSPWHNSWPTPEVHRELCDTIGNFVLLSRKTNQKADNGSFEAKKALYFENGAPEFALTQDVKEHIAWTPEIVRTRTMRLAKILSDDWQLQP